MITETPDEASKSSDLMPALSEGLLSGYNIPVLHLTTTRARLCYVTGFCLLALGLFRPLQPLRAQDATRPDADARAYEVFLLGNTGTGPAATLTRTFSALRPQLLAVGSGHQEADWRPSV